MQSRRSFTSSLVCASTLKIALPVSTASSIIGSLTAYLAPVLASAARPIAEQQNIVTLGIVPKLSARSTAVAYEPLQSFLTQRLKTEVQIAAASDWQAFFRAAQLGAFDIVVAPAHFARLLMQDKAATPVASFQPRIKSILITQKNFSTEQAQALRGKRISFASPLSLVSMSNEAWLQSQGLQKGIDYAISQVRSEDSIPISIIKGESVAGAIGFAEFMTQPPQIREQLRIIATVGEFPNYIVMTSKQVSRDTTETIARNLAQFNGTPEARQLADRTGAVIVKSTSEADWNSVDKFAEKVRLMMA